MGGGEPPRRLAVLSRLRLLRGASGRVATSAAAPSAPPACWSLSSPSSPSLPASAALTCPATAPLPTCRAPTWRSAAPRPSGTLAAAAPRAIAPPSTLRPLVSGVRVPDPGQQERINVASIDAISRTTRSRRAAGSYAKENLLPLRSSQAPASLSQGAAASSTALCTSGKRSSVGVCELLVPARSGETSTVLWRPLATSTTAANGMLILALPVRIALSHAWILSMAGPVFIFVSVPRRIRLSTTGVGSMGA